MYIIEHTSKKGSRFARVSFLGPYRTLEEAELRVELAIAPMRDAIANSSAANSSIQVDTDGLKSASLVVNDRCTESWILCEAHSVKVLKNRIETLNSIMHSKQRFLDELTDDISIIEDDISELRVLLINTMDLENEVKND